MKINRLQRGALLAAAGVIIAVQLNQFSDRGIRGSAWVLAFAVAAGLIFLALSGLGNARQRTTSAIASEAVPVPLGAKRGPGASPTTAPTPRHPFRETDVDRFLDTCHAISRELLPQLYARAGRTPDGKMQGSLHMAGVNPKTGEKVDADAVIAAYVEEASLAYAFGIVSFIACVHSNTWPKSAGCARVRERIAVDLAQVAKRGEWPGDAETPGAVGLKEWSDKVAAEYVEAAFLSAFTYWQPYYALREAAFGGRKLKMDSRKTLLGTEELWLWLDDPTRLVENPLCLLEKRLAEAVGVESNKPDFMKRMEQGFGPITRDLIRRAVALMDAPLVKMA